MRGSTTCVACLYGRRLLFPALLSPTIPLQAQVFPNLTMAKKNKSKSKKQLSCNLCKISFTNGIALEHHVRRYHSHSEVDMCAVYDSMEQHPDTRTASNGPGTSNVASSTGKYIFHKI